MARYQSSKQSLCQSQFAIFSPKNSRSANFGQNRRREKFASGAQKLAAHFQKSTANKDNAL